MATYSGLNNSSRIFLAKYTKTPKLGGVLYGALRLRIIISVFCGILFTALAPFISQLIAKKELDSLFLIGGLFIIFSGFIEFLKQAFIGLRELQNNFFIGLGEHSLKLVFIIIVIVTNSDLFFVFLSIVLALFITSIWGFLCIKKYVTTKKPLLQRELLDYAKPLFFISLSFFAMVHTDTIMLGILDSETGVGIYGVAKDFVSTLPQIAYAVTMGFFPIFAKKNQTNEAKLAKIFNRSLSFIFILFCLIACVVIFLAPIGVPYIYGNEYNAAVMPLQILTLYVVFQSCGILINNFLDYSGKAKKRAWNLSVSLILNITLNFMLIPTFGPTGAAAATLFSFLPTLLLNYIEVQKVLEKIKNPQSTPEV